MAHIGGQSFGFLRLGKQLRIRIGVAGVRRVTAFLALEVHFRITLAAALVWRRTVFGHEALDRGPRTDQCAVHAEMLAGEQLRFFGLLHDAPKQSLDDLVIDQPVAVLGVGAVIPRRVFHTQSHEPTKQHVIAQLLAQQPLTPDSIQRLQHQSAQQPLRRHRIATALFIHRLEQPVHVAQRRVHNLSNRDQGMGPRHVVRGLPHDEQAFLRHIRSTHCLAPLLHMNIRLNVPPSIPWTGSGINSTNC